MAIIKCKMCGGDIVLNEEKTFGTCEYCGSTMTLPKVSDDQRAARFNRGNHFRRQGDFDKALAVYESIVREDDTDAEAHWCCALCRFGIEYVEDPNTFEYLPTCHRASFDSFLEDVDYLAALEHSDGITRRQYQKDAAKIAEVQKGILATSQNEEPFDVFICYKETDDETKERTRDSLDAQEIYYQLTQEGYRVFFARITLEDKVGTEYEPYIFAALNSAKVMVAIGSKPEYFNAVWVKNEWSRFLAMMRKDRSKLLLPCYKGMDPYDLPEQLGVLQSYDMAKIGFMQDLIRGIKKVLRKDEPKPVKETVVVQQAAPVTVGSTNLAAQLKRGKQALEDRDWNAAAEFFDKVLDLDAECAEAFYGKALAEAHCATGEELAKKRIELPVTRAQQLTACQRDDARIARTVKESVIPGYLKEEEIQACFTFDDRTYPSLTAAWESRITEEASYWERDRLMSRAVRFAKGDLARTLQMLRQQVEIGLQPKLEQSKAADTKKKKETTERYTAEMDDAAQRAKQLRVEAEEKRDKDYKFACGRQNNNDSKYALQHALEEFESERLRGYLDSDERAQQCRAGLARLKEEKKQREEKEAAEAQKRRKKKTKSGIIAVAVAVFVITAVIIVTPVIVQNSKYNSAVQFHDAGKYEEAIAAFEALDGYKDSKEQIERCKTAILDQRYDDAINLYDAGKYEEAFAAFEDLDGYKDNAVKMNEIKNSEEWIRICPVGETLFFGSYEQDNDKANGNEEIEWLVLAKENNRILVISKLALRYRQFNEGVSTRTNSTWETSSIRSWLNNDFLESAFTKEEQDLIPTVTVTAEKNPKHSLDPGNGTKDKVFLLSIQEAQKYFDSDSLRKCKAAEIARNRVTDVDGYALWWLRSPCMYSTSGVYVNADGSINYEGFNIVGSMGGVRPAMWINLGS